jgi:hypothetical protein
MADGAPGAGSRYVSVIYNNMIVMTPMFVLFCVVVEQQMNEMPCLSKNPASPFKHTGATDACLLLRTAWSVSCCM